MNEPTVTIELQLYNDMLLAHEKYEMLLDAIFGDANLSWDKRYIEPNCQKLSIVLSFIESHNYETTLQALVERENNKKPGDEQR